MNSPTPWIGTGYFVPDGSRSQLRFRAKVIWENGIFEEKWKCKGETSFYRTKKRNPVPKTKVKYYIATRLFRL